VISQPAPLGLSAERAHGLLSRAWECVLGAPPEPRALALLTAQWALETDTGRQMHGHNFGGIKAQASAPGASFHTVEGHGATRRELVLRFRVYESAEAGANDYVRLLATRYPAALQAARAGDVGGFARELAAGGYFTADPAAYAHGLEQRLHALQGTSTSNAATSQPRVSVGLSEGALSGLLRALRREPDDT
jgi:flagellum-specific peptidoglycan hydrolase FlgJ